MARARSLAAVACFGATLAGCVGDDTASQPPDDAGAAIDATTLVDAATDATSSEAAAADAHADGANGRARCVPSRSLDAAVGDAATIDAASDDAAVIDAAVDAPPLDAGAGAASDAAAVDASADDGATAAPDAAADADGSGAAACPARVLAAIDFDRDPALTYGGRTPDTWSIGKARSDVGPAFDRRFFDGECFLATHPGAIYAPNEDAFAELPPIDLAPVPAGCSITLHVWIWYELEDLVDGANLVVSAAGGPFENAGLAQTSTRYDTDDFRGDECASSAQCSIFGESAWSSFAPGSTTWREARFSLTRWAGQRVTLRFQFHSDHFGEYQGIYLQDPTITIP